MVHNVRVPLDLVCVSYLLVILRSDKGGGNESDDSDEDPEKKKFANQISGMAAECGILL